MPVLLLSGGAETALATSTIAVTKKTAMTKAHMITNTFRLPFI